METNPTPTTLFTDDELLMLIDLFDDQLDGLEVELPMHALQGRFDANQLVHDLAEIVLDRPITMGESGVAFATVASIIDVRAAALRAVAR